MKRVISLMLAVFMTLTLCAFPASAATSEVWDGSVNTSWYTGTNNSYDISTPAELAGLAKLVNEGNMAENVVINLTSDIQLNDTSNWKNWYTTPPKNKFTPIGLSGDPINGYSAFRGLFNGNGHSISGLYVNNYRLAGLFGYLDSACVSNVIIKDSVIIGYDDGKTELTNDGVYVGAIAGIAEGSVINQCENDGLVYAVGPSDIFSGDRTAYAGGIVGSMHTENVSQAVIAGGFAVFGVFYNPFIFTDGNGGLIKNSGVVNCINFNTVTATCANSAYSGGIAGWGNNGIIQNCLNLYKPTATENKNSKGKIGQIAGGLYNCSMINCYYWYDVSKLNALGDDWSTSVVEVKREATACTTDEIMEKSFPQRLGTAFIYAKNDRPYLSCDLRKAVDDTSVSNFVERLYENILNRSSDENNVTHIGNLKDGETACKVAYDFVFSKEFLELDISNEERINRMYLTFLNREADPAGLADWTSVLDNGCSMGHIFHGFTQSNEFIEICAEYGINRGTWEPTENRDKSSKLTAFVARLYTKAMGRPYDVNGLNDHTGSYLENRDLYQLAHNFIFSKEFIEKNLSDEEFVDTMYHTFFDREPDPAGKAGWLDEMKNGMSRENVLAGFVGSQECADLVARFGI